MLNVNRNIIMSSGFINLNELIQQKQEILSIKKTIEMILKQLKKL